MRALFLSLTIVVSFAAEARVAQPMGRSVKEPRDRVARTWTEQGGLFSLARPPAERWSLASGERDADGARIPLVARMDDTGATLSVQSADGVPSAQALARALAERLTSEQTMKVDDPAPVAARGGEAYGFTFTAGAEQRGRVVVVPAGDHLVLVVASWPLGSPAQVVDDVDSMIRSVGPAAE